MSWCEEEVANPRPGHRAFIVISLCTVLRIARSCSVGCACLPCLLQLLCKKGEMQCRKRVVFGVDLFVFATLLYDIGLNSHLEGKDACDPIILS